MSRLETLKLLKWEEHITVADLLIQETSVCLQVYTLKVQEQILKLHQKHHLLRQLFQEQNNMEEEETTLATKVTTLHQDIPIQVAESQEPLNHPQLFHMEEVKVHNNLIQVM